MKAIDYKVCICVLNQTARVAARVHAYKCVILVRVTRVSDTCHTRLALNLSPVCTVVVLIEMLKPTEAGQCTILSDNTEQVEQ